VGSTWFDRTDLRAAAYCGFCKKDVAAHGVELVIGGDPELSHYICPHCRRKIGGSRGRDVFIGFLILSAVVFVVGYAAIIF